MIQVGNRVPPTNGTTPGEISGAISKDLDSKLDQRAERRRKAVVRWRSRGVIWIWRLGILAAFIALWEFSSDRFVDSFYISKPSEVWPKIVEGFSDGSFGRAAWVTIQETVAGFLLGALIGLVGGLLLGSLPRVAKVFDPFILSAYSLPKLALYPLFILWLGLGSKPKIVLAAVLVSFIVFSNTQAGVRNVDEKLKDVLRVIGSTRRQMIWKAVLPSALVWIFAGLRVSLPYALLGAVTGEMLAGNSGIGSLIQRSAGIFDMAGVFAILTVLAVFAVALGGVLTLVERWAVKWNVESPT